MTFFEDEREWNRYADALGIPPEDRGPSSAEVVREQLRREIVEGRQAELRLDRLRSERRRELAETAPTFFVDYSEPRRVRELPWQHPRRRR